MNKTVLKDIIREVKANKGRFFSIMALLLISMIAFSGVFMATILLEDIPEIYYKKYNLHDATISSTMGLAEADEVIIATNTMVEDFEMIKSVDVFVEGTSDIVKIENLPEKITNLIIVEGRLPEESGEIVLGYDFFNDKVSIGEEISFVDGKNSKDIEELKLNKYTIVGLVRSLEHLTVDTRELSTIGSGIISSFGYVNNFEFDIDYYTKARIIGEGLEELISSSDEYEESVQKLLISLEESFIDRPKTRMEEVKQDADENIQDAESEIEKAKKELEEAKQELEDGRLELDDGRIKLLEAEIEIRDGEISLMEARLELNDGWKKYEEGIVELRDSEEDARKEIADGRIKLQDAKIELEKGRTDLAKGRKEYEDGLIELEDAKKKFADGEKLYNDNLKLYEDGRAELDEMKEKIRISKEIRLGEINKTKNKDELEASISSLTTQVANHQENVNNYKAQLNYNESILDTTEDKTSVDNKINELKGLITTEEQNLNNKTNQLNLAKEQLSNFEKVEFEGRVSDEVMDYSDESINEAEKELNSAKTQLDDAKSELEKGRAELQDGINKAEEGRLELEKGERDLREGEAEYNQGLVDIVEAEKTLESELAKGRQELADAKEQLEQGEVDYQQGIIDLRDGKIEYEDGLKEYEEGLEEFKDGEKEFEEKSADALIQISDAEIEIADAKDKLMKLKEPNFMIDSRSADANYHTVKGLPVSLKILAIVLSILALLIALLVAFTSMTRMVDERRVLIGTYKGLGYTNDIISSKFILFGGISGIVGTLLGTYIGQRFVGPLIYEIYMEGMIFSEIISMKSLSLFVIGMVLAIITTTFSAYLSVNKTLRENTASLLRPKAPKSGSRIFLERIKPLWNRLGFMNKITARNIFRYKDRMAMTIIGVAGCMAILILGFGMKFSIESVVNLQFDEIQAYDIMFAIEEEIDEVDFNNAIDKIENNKNTADYAGTNFRILKLQIPGQGTQDVSLIVDMDNKLENLVNLRTRNKIAPIELSDEGVIMTEKLATLMDLDIGDTFNVEVEDEIVEMKLSGINEFYIGHSIYIKEDYYNKLLDNEININMILVDLVDNSEEAEDITSEEILSEENIISSISSRIAKATMNATIDAIDSVIIIIVVIAMLLSLVVLYNLTNINVSERIRELSTMKVLGFYTNELTEYVYKETFVLSIIGIGFGMFLGKIIVEFILYSFAPANVMFGDPNYPLSYAISSVLTLVFTMMVMVLMYLKLKKIDMVEALKSVD